MSDISSIENGQLELAVLEMDSPCIRPADVGKFEEGDEMRFRNAFIEIVEELKMRREHDAESETYIKKLLDAKGTLEQDLELERRNSENLQNKLFRQECDIRRKYETQLTVLEEEKRKAEMRNIYEESEIKGLRDEIKILQLDRFNLERRCKEQDRKLVMVNSSRDSIMSQTTRLGQKCSALKKELEGVTLQVDQLQSCVNAAEQMCCKLSYANSHQDCQLKHYRTEVEQLKKELLDAKVSSRSQNSSSEEEQRLRKKLKLAEHEIRMVKDVSVKLECRAAEMKNENSRLVEALSKAHSLVESHIHGNSQLNETIRNLETSLEDSIERELNSKVVLENLEQTVDVLKQKLSLKGEDWEAKVMEAEDRLQQALERSGTLEETCAVLEEDKSCLLEEKKQLETSAEEVQTERSSLQEALSVANSKGDDFRGQLQRRKKLWETEKNSLLEKLAQQDHKMLLLEKAVKPRQPTTPKESPMQDGDGKPALPDRANSLESTKGPTSAESCFAHPLANHPQSISFLTAATRGDVQITSGVPTLLPRISPSRTASLGQFQSRSSSPSTSVHFGTKFPVSAATAGVAQGKRAPSTTITWPSGSMGQLGSVQSFPQKSPHPRPSLEGGKTVVGQHTDGDSSCLSPQCQSMLPVVPDSPILLAPAPVSSSPLVPGLSCVSPNVSTTSSNRPEAALIATNTSVVVKLEPAACETTPRNDAFSNTSTTVPRSDALSMSSYAKSGRNDVVPANNCTDSPSSAAKTMPVSTASRDQSLPSIAPSSRMDVQVAETVTESPPLSQTRPSLVPEPPTMSPILILSPIQCTGQSVPLNQGTSELAAVEAMESAADPQPVLTSSQQPTTEADTVRVPAAKGTGSGNTESILSSLCTSEPQRRTEAGNKEGASNSLETQTSRLPACLQNTSESSLLRYIISHDSDSNRPTIPKPGKCSSENRDLQNRVSSTLGAVIDGDSAGFKSLCLNPTNSQCPLQRQFDESSNLLETRKSHPNRNLSSSQQTASSPHFPEVIQQVENLARSSPSEHHPYLPSKRPSPDQPLQDVQRSSKVRVIEGIDPSTCSPRITGVDRFADKMPVHPGDVTSSISQDVTIACMENRECSAPHSVLAMSVASVYDLGGDFSSDSAGEIPSFQPNAALRLGQTPECSSPPNPTAASSSPLSKVKLELLADQEQGEEGVTLRGDSPCVSLLSEDEGNEGGSTWQEEHLISSSMAQSISSLQDFLKRDRLRRTRGPLY